MVLGVIGWLRVATILAAVGASGALSSTVGRVSTAGPSLDPSTMTSSSGPSLDPLTVTSSPGPSGWGTSAANLEAGPGPIPPASAAGWVERAVATETTPIITDTGFLVQASDSGSLKIVDVPRSAPLGVWIECAHFILPLFDGPIEVVTTPAVPRAGGAYYLWCWYEPDHVVVPGYPLLVLFDPLEPVPGLVDVIDVAEFAQSQLDFEPPTIELSPAGRQVVGIETWLAVTSELDYPEVTAQAGLAWATVRTTFRDVVWHLGDGANLLCTDHATTTWDREAAPGSQASECSHTYVDSSADAGYPVTATVTWSLDWISNEAPASFVPWATLSLTTAFDLGVDQLQAVIA